MGTSWGESQDVKGENFWGERRDEVAGRKEEIMGKIEDICFNTFLWEN